MWFLLLMLVGGGGLALWMWKRPDPVMRDQANIVQHDLWLENIDARLDFAARLTREAGQENYQRAYQIYEDLNKQHELPQALTQMGLMMWHGHGRDQNQQHAIGLLEKAFRLGGDEAAYQLGMLHQDDLADTEKARYWFSHAAALGHVDAQYKLNALMSDQPDDQLDQQRLDLLKRNAQSGHAGSLYQLAQHALFQTTPPQISEGLDALFQATTLRSLPACQQLYEFYHFGKFVEKDRHSALHYMKTSIMLGAQGLMPTYQQAVLMGQYDVDQRQRVLSDLMAKSREQQDPQAKTLLGHAYFHGWHVEKNQTMAYRYWSEAAQFGSTDALCALAALYFEQHLLDEPQEKAFALYSQAEQKESNYISQMGLALCHIYGIGTVQDMSKAQNLIQLAALKGWQYVVNSSADLHYVIGLFCCMDCYPYSSKDKAIGFLQQAAKLGSKDALWTLHQLYAGVYATDLMDHKQAWLYLQKAADAGQAEAQLKLAQDLMKNPDQQAQAFNYLQQAAVEKPAAQNLLAELYEHGIAIDPDLAQALDYYLQAAAGANPDAYANLGRMYLYGHGVERNIGVAKAWLEKGSRMQHAQSISLLKNIEDYLQP